MPPKSTKSEFITKAIAKHGDQYDYSAVEYVNNATHVDIKCKSCGKVNRITPNKHLSGRGCSTAHCKSLKQSVAQTFTQEKWIKLMQKIHGDKYDYSKTVYSDSRLDVEIFCNECKEYFTQNADSHRRGHGCQKCGGTKLLTQEEFIEQARAIHGDVFDYSLVEYVNMRTKIKIRCKTCDHIFTPEAHSHIEHASGCPYCASLRSEKMCREIFESIFATKFTKIRPPFLEGMELDGYCERLKLAFEYQGIQHYEFVEYWHKTPEGLEKRKAADQRKRDLCAAAGVDLVEVPHTLSYRDRGAMEQFVRRDLEERLEYLLMD